MAVYLISAACAINSKLRETHLLFRHGRRRCHKEARYTVNNRRTSLEALARKQERAEELITCNISCVVSICSSRIAATANKSSARPTMNGRSDWARLRISSDRQFELLLG